jgi:hypothetical protein
MTVWCAAHGMGVTYMLSNGIYPGKKNWNPDIRTTDDKFLMLIDMEENHGFDAEEIKSILKETGVEEISEKVIGDRTESLQTDEQGIQYNSSCFPQLLLLG